MKLLAAVLAAATLSQQPKLPEPQNGIINGRSAVLSWPATLRADGYPGDYLPLAGCEVHLASWDEPDKHFLHPCGAWFVPAPARYFEWLEQGNMISAAYTQLLATGRGNRGLPSTYSMVPAGFVALQSDAGDDVVVRYIHLTRMWRGFVRTERGSTATTPVRMQQGPIFGVEVDRKSGDAVAFIRRIEVPAAKTVRAIAEKPKRGTSAVFVELKPPNIPHKEPVALSLEIDGRSYPADAIVDGYRVYAIWYSVEGRSAKLTVTHPQLTYGGADLTLRPGAITTLHGELKSKPSIAASVTLDGEAALPDMSVEVQKLGETSALRRASIKAGQPLRIEALERAPYRVVLNVPPWKFSRNVDLTDGNDGEVSWALTPLSIRGTVRVGKQPTHARVAFMNEGDEWITTETDAAGEYAATLWIARDYIVRIHADEQKEPFSDLIAVDRSDTFDFTLPDTHYTVSVRSAANGKPIEGAIVRLNNAWDSQKYGRENVVQTVTTDSDGHATLPPLRSGTLEITAEAKGFRKAENASYRVQAEGAASLEVALSPIESSHTLRIRLPDGLPASDAELLATDRSGTNVLWRSRADAAGEVELPHLDAGSLLLVRHSRAASSVRVSQGDDQEAADWLLAAPVELLTLRIETRAGDRAPASRLTLWLGDVALRGTALAFATWSSPIGNRDGLWTARNLPRAAFRILASQKNDAAVAAGAFDALAVVAPYPLPAGFTIRAID